MVVLWGHGILVTIKGVSVLHRYNMANERIVRQTTLDGLSGYARKLSEQFKLRAPNDIN